jgi:hypothetical protein
VVGGEIFWGAIPPEAAELRLGRAILTKGNRRFEPRSAEEGGRVS